MSSPPPTTFGKYQILERIAVGGMAEIFKARIEGIGGFQRVFAIKRILPHLSSNPDFVDLLVDEAKVAGLLSHANIVQILDLGRIDDHYFIAMEYVPGHDLGKLLERCRLKGITLPVPHAIFITIEVLKGLEYAHNRQVMRGGRAVPLNIVHRDVTPPNLLVSYQGEVKITDFGIAKASIKALETMAGVVKGRYDYLSPEQSDGKPIDQRSDLFGVGVVLYEMLTGTHPFRKEADIPTLDAIRSGRYTPASYVNPDVPYSIDDVIEKALATSSDDRFQTATAFKEALDGFFAEAGFIFSQSTLAAFLKGLFPEQANRGRGPRFDEMKAAPRLVEEDLDDPSLDNLPSSDEVLPTVIKEMPRQPISPFEPLPSYEPQRTEPGAGRDRVGPDSVGDPMQGQQAGPRPTGASINDAATVLRRIPQASENEEYARAAMGFGDAQTLIRKNPLLDDNLGDLETQIRRNPFQDGDLADLPPFRPSVALPLASPPQGPPPAAPLSSPSPPSTSPPSASWTATPAWSSAPPASPEPRPASVIKEAPPVHARTPAPQAAASRSPTSMRWQVIYLIGSLFTLVVGLLAGMMIGARLASSIAPVTLKEEPVLDLRVPTGSQVEVDGRQVPGEPPFAIRLSPAKAHQVRLTLPNSQPLEFPVTLDYNQRWLYLVQTPAAPPAPPK